MICKKCNEPYELKAFQINNGYCKSCSPSIFALSIKELIVAILFVSIIFMGWLYVYGGPESQSYGMSRTHAWLEEHKSEWQELQQKYPGLKEVKMHVFTGYNGCLVVSIPRLINEKDELILYRFLLKYDVNRPIKVFK